VGVMCCRSDSAQNAVRDGWCDLVYPFHVGACRSAPMRMIAAGSKAVMLFVIKFSIYS
jgi:hypothetical protein